MTNRRPLTAAAAGSLAPRDGPDTAWRGVDLRVAALVLAAFAALVLVRSHYFGLLTDDSNGYLALAQNLVDGRGFHLPALGMPDQLFSIWPVGYPTLIALVAMLSGLPVFEASKLLNILLAGVNLVLLKQIFDRDFPWFAWILLLPPMVETGGHTWSEVPFTTGMLWLAVSASRFVDGRMPAWRAALGMALATALMFLSRYIGAFGVGVIAAVAMAALLRGDLRRFGAAALAAAICAAGVIGYLYNNLLATGHATGMQRLPAPEPASWLAAMTVKAHVKQLDLLLAEVDLDTLLGRIAAGLTLAVLVAMAIYVALGRRSNGGATDAASPAGSLPWLLIGVGLTYLTAITAMRWLAQFDNLSTRLLFAGTLLILLGLMGLGRSTTVATRLRRVASVGAVFGLAVLVSGDVYRWHAPPTSLSHPERTARILTAAAPIPPGAIAVFGDVSLAYLRRDLLQLRPAFRPLHPAAERWSEFEAKVLRHAGNRPVYVFVQDSLDPQKFDPSVIEFMTLHHGQTIVRILPK